ncbi:ATP-binding cassette domain-containing protein [Spirochaeta dissipatitropha]
MMQRVSRKHVSAAIGITILLLFWALAAAAVNREILVPGPLRVVAELLSIASRSSTYLIIYGSILRWLISFMLALSAGIISGSLAYRYPDFSDGIRPLVISIRSIPVIAIILIALVWLPLNHVGVLVGLLVAYPLIHQGVLDGLRSVDVRLIEMSDIFHVSFLRAVKRIYFPGSLPVVLSTMISAVGMSWKAVIAAEVLSQPRHGIGTALQTAKLYIDTPAVFAWTIIAVLLAALVDGLLLVADRRLYHHSSRKIPVGKKNIPHFVPNSSEIFPSWKTQELPALHAEKLCFSYGSLKVFHELDLEIEAGKITVLFGPSGCGKTTLLRLFAGSLHAESGRIFRTPNDRTVPPRYQTSFIFQDPRLLPWANLEQNLELVCTIHPGNKRKYVCREILEQIKLPLPLAYPDQLSGGMQQRLNLARGFLHPAGLLCLDEPFANQDRATRDELLKLSLELQQFHGSTMLWVTHDPQEAVSVADRILIFGKPDSLGSRIEADYHFTGPEDPERQKFALLISNC